MYSPCWGGSRSGCGSDMRPWGASAGRGQASSWNSGLQLRIGRDAVLKIGAGYSGRSRATFNPTGGAVRSRGARSGPESPDGGCPRPIISLFPDARSFPPLPGGFCAPFLPRTLQREVGRNPQAPEPASAALPGPDARSPPVPTPGPPGTGAWARAPAPAPGSGCRGVLMRLRAPDACPVLIPRLLPRPPGPPHRLRAADAGEEGRTERAEGWWAREERG